MERSAGVDVEMMGVRMRHTDLTQPEEIEAVGQNAVLMDREAPGNKFKLFSGRQIQMMSLSISRF